MGNVKLPRIPGGSVVVSPNGKPHPSFLTPLNTSMGMIEKSINQLIPNAQTTANNAQTTANSKAKVTRSSTAPSSPNTNDVWIDTSVSPVVVRDWNGSAWVANARYTTIVDELTDGTYGKTLSTRLSSGKPVIDFSEGIHSNKNLDNIADGTTYGSLPLTNITGTGTSKRALIDFSQGHANKSLANVDSTANTKLSGIAAGATVGADWGTNLTSRPTELTDGRVAAGLNSGGFIDFSRSHLNKSLANVDSSQNSKLNGIDTNATASDNLLPNSAMLTNSTGWVLSNCTRTAATTSDPIPYYCTTTSSAADASLNMQNISLTNPSTKLYLGCWIKPGVSGQQFQLGIQWADSSGTSLSFPNQNFFPASTSWQWIEAAFTRPATAVMAPNCEIICAHSGTAIGLFGGLRLSATQAGATVGADWSSNLTSRPTELTDGRVAAGLNASGGIDFSSAAHTNKSLANVDSAANTKLGGIAAGATVGATWGTNISSTPANLAALTGGEGIKNSLISLSAAGALSGAGGGSIAYDSIPDGTTYSKVKSTNVTGTGLIDYDSLTDGTTYAKIKGTYMTTGQPNLQIGTTGQQIGDVRNLPPVRGANLGYKYTGTLSVGTLTTTSAAISLTAGSIQAGAATIAYNAGSASITGLSANTTYTYFFYYSDTGYAGGTKTLNFTTSSTTPYSNDAYIYMGSATFTTPASGTSSGGSTYTGGGGCVHADSWIETQNRGWVKAKAIEAGDLIQCLTDDSGGVEWVSVLSNKVQPENGYEIESESGIKLRCSSSTPLTLRDGSSLSLNQLDGHELPVLEDGQFRWESCRASFKGAMSVCYISLGGRVYAAGTEQGRSILTHNATSKP